MTNKAKFDWDALLAAIDSELGSLQIAEKSGGEIWEEPQRSKGAAFLRYLVFTIERISKLPKADYVFMPEAGLPGFIKLEALVKYLDSKIHLPWFLESLDEIAIRWIIGLVVEMIKKQLGDNWFTNGEGEPVQTKINWVQTIMEKDRMTFEKAMV